MQVTPHGGLANRCTRPLCDLSVATAAGILSWSPRSSDPSSRGPEGAAHAHLPGRVDGAPEPRGRAPGRHHRPADAGRRTDRARRLRPDLAAAVRAGGGPRAGDAWLAGPAARARRVDVRAGPRRPSRSSTWCWPSRTPADEPAYVPSMRGRRLRPADPRARLARAPAVQGPGHGRSTSTPLRRARPRSSGCSPSATGCGRHDDERELYLRTKRELAARHWVYVQDYADAKGEVVEAIIARAGSRPRVDIERANRYRPEHRHEPHLLLSMPGMTLRGR